MEPPVPYSLTGKGHAELDQLDRLDLTCAPIASTPDAPPTSPAAMDMLRESHAAALSNALDVGQRYLKGEATAEEVTKSGRDLDMTSDLLYRGEHPEKEGAE